MNFCSSVSKCKVEVYKILRLGKKVDSTNRPLLLGFKNCEDKGLILSRAHLLCQNDQYSNIFINPNRTKFEREKLKKLVAELEERRSRGESGLIIRDGTIVSGPPRPANKLTTSEANPIQSS